MRKIVSIFDIDIPGNTFSDLDSWVQNKLLADKQVTVAKVNSEFLLRSLKKPDFKKYLQNSDLNIPDGIGVLWAAKYLSLPSNNPINTVWQMVYTGAALVFNHNYAKDVLLERLSGVEVFKTMLEACAKSEKSVYIFGAKPEVLDKAIKNIHKEFPGLKIAGSHDGYSNKGSEVVADINKSGAEMLIVALGSPEQEYWIRDNIVKLPTIRVAVGEGGSLDYIAGNNVRAPKFFQRIGLEWLWRGLFAKNLTTDGGHRFRRVWNAVPVFIYEVVKWKLKNGATTPLSSLAANPGIPIVPPDLSIEALAKLEGDPHFRKDDK
ncbi:MAG: WecB/TagA/CpsF family glycosyltransferase [bacterium]